MNSSLLLGLHCAVARAGIKFTFVSYIKLLRLFSMKTIYLIISLNFDQLCLVFFVILIIDVVWFAYISD